MVQKSGYPVEFGSLSQYLHLFFYIPGGWPWDFWSIKSRNQGEHPFVFTAKTPSFLGFLWHGWGGVGRKVKNSFNKKPTQNSPNWSEGENSTTWWWLVASDHLKKKTVKSTPIWGVMMDSVHPIPVDLLFFWRCFTDPTMGFITMLSPPFGEYMLFLSNRWTSKSKNKTAGFIPTIL